MNTDVYSQFLQITQIDSSAVKSIFMHLSAITAKVNSLKFEKLVLSLNNDPEYTLVYDLNKGKRIPLSAYHSLSMLFNNTSYLAGDICINIELTYEGKIYNIIYENSELNCPAPLHFLFSENKYFNFFTSIHDTKSNLELFERLFEFVIKKELPLSAESIFKIQFEKYYSGFRSDNENIVESKNVDNEILIEKLLKTKNELFSRINSITQTSTKLAEEKDKLLDYAQNKERYSIKYESLKDDYKMLTEQSKTYFRNVLDLKNVIEQISQELANVQIHLEMNNTPAAEQTKMIEEKDFLIDKKLTFVAALTEAEANLATMNNMIASTKLNMESTYNDLDIINHTTLDDMSTYDTELSKIKNELDDLYLQTDNIDVELNKLQKESSSFNITREYAELKSKGTEDIEYNALKSSLTTSILPSSINVAYKYLSNLFLYLLEKNSVEGCISVNTLAEFNIFPQTFFSKYNKEEVIIS